MIETRVGYTTTSILEELCLDYLKCNPTDVEYLIKYSKLRIYNQNNQCIGEKE